MQTLSECRGFEESCVLIYSLFLDFPKKLLNCKMPTVMSYLSDVSKGVWITYSLRQSMKINRTVINIIIIIIY